MPKSQQSQTGTVTPSQMAMGQPTVNWSLSVKDFLVHFCEFWPTLASLHGKLWLDKDIIILNSLAYKEMYVIIM